VPVYNCGHDAISIERNMIKEIFALVGTALSIWESKEAKQYQEKLLKLEKAYDEENDKPIPDRNVLGHIDRAILRLSNLVRTEIGRSRADS
jgi:hypothetical protein